MDAMAAIIDYKNYGAHRFISALIRARDARYDSSWTQQQYEERRARTQMLRDLLEKGFY